MKKIDHPKVFISYAWGTDEYQQKVLDFAKMLKHNGVQVLLDKWSVNAGNDLNAFMEKCVNDVTVTNVIILLDENYEKKADARKGGVGAETQIISQEIYNSVEQDKFIPVVFERDANGIIRKPVYLRSRSHIDLSVEDTFDRENRKLMKHIFGREIYIEPELGEKPGWLDDDIEIPLKKQVSFSFLKENMSQQTKRERFSECLEIVKKEIDEFANLYKKPLQIPDEYLGAYESTKQLRAEYLRLINSAAYVEDSNVLIGNFLEDTFNLLNRNDIPGTELCLVFLHELFLNTIALFLKKKQYELAGYLLGRTYFIERYISDENSYNIFRSNTPRQIMDKAVEERNKTKYLSGTSVYWLNNLDSEFLSVMDIVFADEICANYSIYGNNYVGKYRWFPNTYWKDDDKYDNNIKRLAIRLKSKEQAQNITSLFNYSSIDDLKRIFCEIAVRIANCEFKNFGYQGAFNNVPLLGFYIKADEIATIR